jgi:hypothetical protein
MRLENVEGFVIVILTIFTILFTSVNLKQNYMLLYTLFK